MVSHEVRTLKVIRAPGQPGARSPTLPCPDRSLAAVPSLMVKAIVPVPIKVVTPISAMRVVIRSVIRPHVAGRLDHDTGATDAHAHDGVCLSRDAGTHTRDHKSSTQSNG